MAVMESMIKVNVSFMQVLYWWRL